MPAERQFAFGSVSDDPDIRDFRISSHLARYSGLSLGAVSGRPARPSITGTGRGGVPAPRGGAGGAFALNGKYTPEKSGRAGASCARAAGVDPSSALTTRATAKS